MFQISNLALSGINVPFRMLRLSTLKCSTSPRYCKPTPTRSIEHNKRTAYNAPHTIIPIKEITMKLLAFAASNSTTSINKKLVQYASSQLKEGILPDIDVELIDLNDYEMAIYSPEREESGGIPEQATSFYQKIGEADVLLISFAEHNGYYTSAYKNLFDWTSRIDTKVYQDKPMVLMATSPGKGGAANALKTAVESAPYFGMDVKGSISIPAFYDNFDMAKGELSNAELREQLVLTLSQLK